MREPSAPTQLQELAEEATRGKFIARVAAFCGGVFAAAAGVQQASAEENWVCCTLAMPNNWCQSQGLNDWVCPPGFAKRRWYCCTPSGQMFGCGECTTGNSCWVPDFACSFGYNTGVLC